VASDPYVYPGTDVLKNKFDVRDQSELNTIEADLVWKRFVDIYEGDISHVPLSVELHRAVHKHLFELVYPFAGTFRTVDMSKDGEIVYAAAAFLQDNAEKTWQTIRKRFLTPPTELNALLEPLAESMGDLHVLHPFREGNTRTLQLLTREIAWRAGFSVQWMNANPALIRFAGTAAAVGDNAPYIDILKSITVRRDEKSKGNRLNIR
jgi:cell filamentation protein